MLSPFLCGKLFSIFNPNHEPQALTSFLSINQQNLTSKQKQQKEDLFFFLFNFPFKPCLRRTLSFLSPSLSLLSLFILSTHFYYTHYIIKRIQSHLIPILLFLSFPTFRSRKSEKKGKWKKGNWLNAGYYPIQTVHRYLLHAHTYICTEK